MLERLREGNSNEWEMGRAPGALDGSRQESPEALYGREVPLQVGGIVPFEKQALVSCLEL